MYWSTTTGKIFCLDGVQTYAAPNATGSVPASLIFDVESDDNPADPYVIQYFHYFTDGGLARCRSVITPSAILCLSVVVILHRGAAPEGKLPGAFNRPGFGTRRTWGHDRGFPKEHAKRKSTIYQCLAQTFV
jgi:hypothetical protein